MSAEVLERLEADRMRAVANVPARIQAGGPLGRSEGVAYHVVVRPEVSRAIGLRGLDRQNVVRLLTMLHTDLGVRGDRRPEDDTLFRWQAAV